MNDENSSCIHNQFQMSTNLGVNERTLACLYFPVAAIGRWAIVEIFSFVSKAKLIFAEKTTGNRFLPFLSGLANERTAPVASPTAAILNTPMYVHFTYVCLFVHTFHNAIHFQPLWMGKSVLIRDLFIRLTFFMLGDFKNYYIYSPK